MREAAQPVCSPWYAEAHRDTLAGPVTGWGELTFLFTFERTEHCADWDDWFAIAGRPGPEPVIERYEYDANVLEAAAVGRGIALGWRGYVERLIAAGTLVTPTDGCRRVRQHVRGSADCGRTRKRRRAQVSRILRRAVLDATAAPALCNTNGIISITRSIFYFCVSS